MFEGKEGAIKARLDGRRPWDGGGGNQFNDTTGSLVESDFYFLPEGTANRNRQSSA